MERDRSSECAPDVGISIPNVNEMWEKVGGVNTRLRPRGVGEKDGRCCMRVPVLEATYGE